MTSVSPTRALNDDEDCDPYLYVVCERTGHTETTETVPHTNAPRWDQTYAFPKVLASDVLQIECFDYDVFGALMQRCCSLQCPDAAASPCPAAAPPLQLSTLSACAAPAALADAAAHWTAQTRTTSSAARALR